MTKLSGRDRILVGLTLFSMFFGAGNLIFPPFLGAQAGVSTPVAMLGFGVTAIGFPILGVIAVARAGGLDALASRVSPRFSQVFTLLIFLSIGPCLAIPRTASTSFEMAVTPFWQDPSTLLYAQLGYSVLFFAVACYFSLTPEKLTQLLGRFTSPCLLLLIAVIFVGCLIRPAGGYGEPYGAYAQSPFIQGFLDGYLTMDTIAALNFGIVISLNINNRGVTDRNSVVRETIRAGWMAGGIFLVVYAAIAHIGAVSGGAFGTMTNGTQALTAVTSYLFGSAGILILGAIFVLACLNTCIGLISSCSEYFALTFPRISHRKWAVFFAFVSMVISNAGLDLILAVSVPVLNIIYPVSIVLILLSFWDGAARRRYVYPLSITLTGITSVLCTLATGQYLGPIPGLTGLLAVLPAAIRGLLWVGPAAAGILLGLILSPKAEPAGEK
ncbi:MAG: branched-chain amino acid transport system II carrier protein [Clostridiales bacterium]|nr:branched-chain amino acid transport system II carrier protein [Clostridiales bacterium]